MKKINREDILRMMGGQGTGSSRSSGGGGGGGIALMTLSNLTDVNITDPQNYDVLLYNSDDKYWYNGSIPDMATKTWANGRFLTIDFFRSLFQAFNANSTEVRPNNGDTTTITNIKAMFGFWTEQYISALGQGSGGGGGGVTLNEPLLGINNAGLASHPSAAGQTIVWNGSNWIYGVVGNQGVTSVGLSAPTGFTVSGSPITSSGTMQLKFATGYSLPTTAKQANWDTAYDWGNHAQAGYALASNVYTKTAADSKFLTISFFRSLFKAFNANNSEVKPNNGDTTTITSIKAMFGFWTDQYLSALGQGSGGGGGGVDIDAVWSAMNNATNEQINISHLTYALDGYATETWVSQNFNKYTLPTATASVLGGVKVGTTLAISSGVLNQKSGIVTAGTYSKVTVDTYGRVTGSASLAASDIPNLSADKITSGTLPIARGGTGATSAFAAIENLGGLSLASRGSNIPDNTDLNTYTTAGKYYCANSTHASTMTNPPTTGSGFTLIVYVNYTTSRLIQKAFLSNYNTRFRYTDDGGATWSAWKTFAYTDSDISGNAATATALATSRTIWGQSFNGTGNISGNMTGVGSIAASGDIAITRTTTTASNFIATNSKGSVSLKTSTNRGVYDESTDKWIITTNGTNTWLNSGNVAIDSAANTSYKLWVNGTIGTNDDVTIYNDKSLLLRDTGGTAREAVKMTTSDNLRIGYGTRAAGNTYIYGTALYFRYGASGSSTAIYVNSSGNVGIGTTSPSEKLHVSGVIFASTGIYSNGYVSALGQNTSSDIRLKDVKDEQAIIDIRQIADAPAIHYTWKDRKDLGVQVGSIAQYWQRIMPEAVHQAKDGSLTMQYDVLALLTGISTARKVVDHERRIKELEEENKKLKMKLKIA